MAPALVMPLNKASVSLKTPTTRARLCSPNGVPTFIMHHQFSLPRHTALQLFSLPYPPISLEPSFSRGSLGLSFVQLNFPDCHSQLGSQVSRAVRCHPASLGSRQVGRHSRHGGEPPEVERCLHRGPGFSSMLAQGRLLAWPLLSLGCRTPQLSGSVLLRCRAPSGTHRLHTPLS